jgi:hypothetical protein
MMNGNAVLGAQQGLIVAVCASILQWGGVDQKAHVLNDILPQKVCAWLK